MHNRAKRSSKKLAVVQLFGFATIATALGIAGCATVGGQSASSTQATPAKSEAVATTASSGKTGAQLWAENCNRCHNYRSPSEFSASEWPLIVHEMRVRAPLTGEQERKITKFLQSASASQ